MKTLYKILSIAVIMMIAAPSFAQKTADGERVKSLMKTKLKAAKKEAKSLEKDGWFTAPGQLPLEKQLEVTYTKQLETDDNGFPAYIVASGNSLAGTQSAAKLQATELAKLEIANQLSSQIAATIDNQIANNQINQEEAATLQKTVAVAKNVVAQKMGRVIGLVEMYRKNEKTKNIECAVRIGYSQELARQMAIQAMKDELQDEANIAADKLDKLLDF